MARKTKTLQEKEQSENNPIYVYSKKVKEGLINSDKKTRKIDKEKISKVIGSLLGVGKTKYFDEVELEQNCKDWVTSLLKTYPNIDERDIKELLNDFSDSMYTRMRGEEKYTIAVISEKSLILCHSIFGEETITPKWEVIERMLDKDNVIRFVYFKQEGEKIKIIFYEDTRSIFFVQWLGLPEREAFSYMGGKNRIFTEINDSPLVFEFTDEEFEKKIIKDKIFHIKGNQIILPNPIQRLPITQIRVGKKPYDNAGDFIQDFLAKRYDLKYYQEEYTKLKSSLQPLITKLIDCEHELRNSEGKILVEKRNPNFYILFCDDVIEVKQSFLDKLKTKILNGENFKLFHAGANLSPTPFKVKGMEIYNNIKYDNTKFIIDYYNQLKLKDSFDTILVYLIFYSLKEENKEIPISHFLEKMVNSLTNEIDFSYKFANLEDDIIELKSRDFISGSNQDIVKKLSEDITKKTTISTFKIYLLGADEKNKEFEPITSYKFDDSRINQIKDSLQKNVGNLNVNFLKILSKDSKNCILALIVKKGVENAN